MEFRAPVEKESVFRVAVKTTSGALERALTNDVADVIQKEGPRSRTTGNDAADSTVVVRKEVLSHLGTADPCTAHLAPKDLPFTHSRLLLRIRCNDFFILLDFLQYQLLRGMKKF